MLLLTWLYRDEPNVAHNVIDLVNRLLYFEEFIYETKKENIGLIAQDVEKAFPQLIDKNKDGYLGVRYTELIPVLVKAIQEQQTQIEQLKQQLNNYGK